MGRVGRDEFKRDEKWKCPDLGHSVATYQLESLVRQEKDDLQPNQETLVQLLRYPCPEQQLDDEDNVGRDRQQIGLEGAKAQSLEVERQVGFRN